MKIVKAKMVMQSEHSDDYIDRVQRGVREQIEHDTIVRRTMWVDMFNDAFIPYLIASLIVGMFISNALGCILLFVWICATALIQIAKMSTARRG